MSQIETVRAIRAAYAAYKDAKDVEARTTTYMEGLIPQVATLEEAMGSFCRLQNEFPRPLTALRMSKSSIKGLSEALTALMGGQMFPAEGVTVNKVYGVRIEEDDSLPYGFYQEQIDGHWQNIRRIKLPAPPS